MRAPNTLAAKFPGTSPAVNASGECDSCGRKRRGAGPKHKPVERPYIKHDDTAQKARREAELMQWRQRFEADRRRRGIPVEGILFKGETASIPVAPVKPTEEKYKVRPRCLNNHEYDIVDAAGRRRCSTCMSNNAKNTRPMKRVAEQAEDGEAPHGRCSKSHPYILDKYGKKLCRACRNEQKQRWRARRKEQDAQTLEVALRQAS